MRRFIIFLVKKTIQSLRLGDKSQNIGENSNRLRW